MTRTAKRQIHAACRMAIGQPPAIAYEKLMMVFVIVGIAMMDDVSLEDDPAYLDLISKINRIPRSELKPGSLHGAGEIADALNAAQQLVRNETRFACDKPLFDFIYATLDALNIGIERPGPKLAPNADDDVIIRQQPQDDHRFAHLMLACAGTHFIGEELRNGEILQAVASAQAAVDELFRPINFKWEDFNVVLIDRVARHIRNAIDIADRTLRDAI